MSLKKLSGASTKIPSVPKGIAGPGLLAETIVKRWCDHQPLHRQEGIFARDGLELARLWRGRERATGPQG